MKKALVMLAAIVIWVAPEALLAEVFPGSTDFEGLAMSNTFFDGATTNASIVADATVASEISASGRPNHFAYPSDTRADVLSVETEVNNPVLRKLKADGSSVDLHNESVYVDMLVKFSVLQAESDCEFLENTKFAVYLREASDYTSTNLCVWAKHPGTGAGFEYVLNNTPVTVKADNWYRLVVKAVPDVLGTPGQVWPGFEVYLNGADAANICDSYGTNRFVSLLANGSTSGTLTSIGYAGCGSVDDFVASTFDPAGSLVSYDLGTSPAGATAPERFCYYNDGTAKPLDKPSYQSDDTAFAGWKWGDSAVHEIPAGTVGDLTLTSVWVSASTTVVKPTSESGASSLPVKIPSSWLAEKFPDATTAEARQAALNTLESNGNLAWQNYMLGLDASTDLVLDAPQGTNANFVSLIPNLNPPATDSGLTLAYSVERVVRDGTVVDAGDAAVSPDGLGIDLTAVESNAFYRLKVSFAAGSGVESSNTIGILRIAPTADMSVISVPWCSLEGGGAVLVSNLVRTANLQAGNRLHIYNKAQRRYDVWELDANKTWTPSKIYKISSGGVLEEVSGKPDSTTVARGVGVWLERSASQSGQPIYLCGQYNPSSAATPVDAGWNLLASPSMDAFDIAKGVSNFNSNDRIIVPSATLPKVYTYTDGAWGYTAYTESSIDGVSVPGLVKPTRVTNDTKINAGTGFWYVSEGEEGPSIAW